MKHYQTIIIGGGIAGLGCAQALHKQNYDFLLITENIKGRILSSNDGAVNYGAYYVTKDYAHLLPYVSLQTKINPLLVFFHNRKQGYTMINKKLFSHSLQFIKLLFYLYRFRKHYNELKKKCLFMTQKRALQQDHFLFGLYKQNASQFVQQKGIENITQDYLAELITATTFLPLEKQSAFTFLQFCLPIIVPTHTFTFLWKKLLQGFEHKILLDTVTQIRKTKANYVVQTTQGKCLSSTYLVIATPPLIAQQLLHLKKIKKPTLVHMYHLKGELKEKGKRWQEYFFLPTNDIFVIARQPDKSYLLYSRKEKPPFQHYFQKYKVINHHFWNPAFHLQGDILLDQKYKPHLYVAGDHNLCGMEDAFISGVFAARQILKEQEKI